MITSKTEFQGYCPSAFMTLICMGMFILMVSQNIENRPEDVIVILLILSYLLLFGTRFWNNSRYITINTIDKTINFTHFFTRQKVTYDFKDIEGYIEVVQSPYLRSPLSDNSFLLIYLVQDNKFVDEISSFAYSNFDEMKEALKDINFLGQEKHSYFKYFKIMLGQNKFKS